jgi:hypothetical protein
MYPCSEHELSGKFDCGFSLMIVRSDIRVLATRFFLLYVSQNFALASVILMAAPNK